MQNLILFLLLSIPVIIISWRTLFNIKSHGFYRFLSWECILWLFVGSYRVWFQHPFSYHQIAAWILLIAAAYVVIAGVIELRKYGRTDKSRDEKELYGFEKTSKLVDTGIFEFIRHPLYASLVFLTWGIFFKNISLSALLISLISTFFLYITARYDEKECIGYFGEAYRQYMKRTKRFIPYLF